MSNHLTGGKITYRYLGSNRYEITLSIYRDCGAGLSTTPFDNPAFISIFDKGTNNLVYNSGFALKSVSVVPVTVANPCFIPPAGICLDVGIYVDTVQLNPNPLGYTITYQRYARNSSILNIVLPSNDGITLTTDIPPQINNTPQFINSPPIFICLTDTFKYSFASTDIDGDILKYNLCSPLIGASNVNQMPNPASPPPYPPIIWLAPNTMTNPIPNSGGLTLNQNTGQLKFKPSLLGQYAIGVCVEEYRNNILINTNRLELQFNIVMCYLTSSIPTASNLCEGLTIPFQNSSTNANAFHWNFGDPTTLADTSNMHTPTYTYPSYGTYTVSLTVFNTAYGFCKDSTKKVISVHPLLSPTLQPTYSSCFKNNSFNFNVGGSFDPSANFNWNFTANSNSPNTLVNNANAHFTTPTTKTVSVIINQFGCKDTLHTTVSFTNPIAVIDEQPLNCNEKNLPFNNFSSDAINFFWNFGDPSTTSDTSYQSSATYTYNNYGNYNITLIAYNGLCSDTSIKTIHVFPKLQLNSINNIPPQCLKNNLFNFVPTGIWGNNATFYWQFHDQPNLITSSQQNPDNIHFTMSGNHIVKYTVSENGCTRAGITSVLINSNPKSNVQLSDTTGCEPLTIKFKSIADTLHPIQNYWTIDNTEFTDTTISYTFNNAGLYSYNLIVRDSNNCTDTLSKLNSIQINPTPKIKSFTNPFYASILDPRITFIDSTQLNHNTNYSFGDGSTSTQPNIVHSYQAIGEYSYSLIVSTQYGCSDTATGIIYIDDINNNYVPNIFTPNGDGANDNFFIKGKNITSSSMQIFNRWGEVVCNTSNALIGWNGINQNNNLIADDGTYFYIIEITLGNNRTYKFNGNVTVLK